MASILSKDEYSVSGKQIAQSIMIMSDEQTGDRGNDTSCNMEGGLNLAEWKKDRKNHLHKSRKYQPCLRGKE